MEYIDLKGKLNKHKDYLKIIEKLEEKTKYVEIVLIDNKEDEMIEVFEKDILEVSKVNSWWGTETEGEPSALYKIKATPKLFEFLKGITTFCITEKNIWGESHTKTTEFGYKDIAFFDEKEELIFCTTTHEGELFLRGDLK